MIKISVFFFVITFILLNGQLHAQEDATDVERKAVDINNTDLWQPYFEDLHYVQFLSAMTENSLISEGAGNTRLIFQALKPGISRIVFKRGVLSRSTKVSITYEKFVLKVIVDEFAELERSPNIVVQAGHYVVKMKPGVQFGLYLKGIDYGRDRQRLMQRLHDKGFIEEQYRDFLEWQFIKQ